jgi:hypothetical protein
MNGSSGSGGDRRKQQEAHAKQMIAELEEAVILSERTSDSSSSIHAFLNKQDYSAEQMNMIFGNLRKYGYHVLDVVRLRPAELQRVEDMSPEDVSAIVRSGDTYSKLLVSSFRKKLTKEDVNVLLESKDEEIRRATVVNQILTPAQLKKAMGDRDDKVREFTAKNQLLDNSQIGRAMNDSSKKVVRQILERQTLDHSQRREAIANGQEWKRFYVLLFQKDLEPDLVELAVRSSSGNLHGPDDIELFCGKRDTTISTTYAAAKTALQLYSRMPNVVIAGLKHHEEDIRRIAFGIYYVPHKRDIKEAIKSGDHGLWDPKCWKGGDHKWKELFKDESGKSVREETKREKVYDHDERRKGSGRAGDWGPDAADYHDVPVYVYQTRTITRVDTHYRITSLCFACGEAKVSST